MQALLSLHCPPRETLQLPKSSTRSLELLPPMHPLRTKAIQVLSSCRNLLRLTQLSLRLFPLSHVQRLGLSQQPQRVIRVLYSSTCLRTTMLRSLQQSAPSLVQAQHLHPPLLTVMQAQCLCRCLLSTMLPQLKPFRQLAGQLLVTHRLPRLVTLVLSTSIYLQSSISLSQQQSQLSQDNPQHSLQVQPKETQELSLSRCHLSTTSLPHRQSALSAGQLHGTRSQARSATLERSMSTYHRSTMSLSRQQSQPLQDNPQPLLLLENKATLALLLSRCRRTLMSRQPRLYRQSPDQPRGTRNRAKSAILVLFMLICPLSTISQEPQPWLQ